jgi:hypothetical protein
MAYRRDHFTMGKEYDEAAFRRNLGLPAVAVAEHLPETPERKRLVRIGDREADRELKEAEALSREAVEAQNRATMLQGMKDQQIQDLQSRIAELEAARGGPIVHVAGKPADTKPLPDGGPQPEWTVGQMKAWLEAQGFPLPPRSGVGMTKTSVLEFCLEQQSQRDAATAAATNAA